MSNTTVSSANKVQQWDSDFYKEYVRDSQFSSYMGTDSNSVIQIKEDLTKKAGDRITVSLVRKLTGAGVTGTSTLEGNEEAIINYGHQLTVDMVRNGVRIHKMEEIKTEIDLLNAGKALLKSWSMEKARSSILAALGSAKIDGKTPYASCTEAEKDAWLAANSDRVLAGIAKANTSTNDHSSSLANIDNTNDKLSPDMLSLAKRMAKTATNGAIRPVNVKDGEWFVFFAGSQAFRDFKSNSTMTAANREAWTRGRENPLFTDGDLIWDGIIIKEVPELAVISGVGAGSIDVAPGYLCGAQALGFAVAQRTTSRTKNFDYDVESGIAIQEIRGIEKLMFNSVQHGVVTVYSAGVADG